MKALAVPVVRSSSPVLEHGELLLLWPTVAVLGFLALAAVVIALGRGSTARYEYERNHVKEQQPAAATAVVVTGPATGPAGGSAGNDAQPGRGRGASASGGLPVQRTAVGVAAHPGGTRIPERAAATAWWLIDETCDEPGSRVVAGPFADRIEAEWEALATGLSAATRPVYGLQRPGGAVLRRQSPQEGAWLAELEAQLARLPEDWDELLSDTDALTTLVVEVGTALLEAGLSLHDCARRGAGGGPAGGVCLTPDPGSGGILVTWRQHDRMSVEQVRGAAADAAVQRTMSAAVAQLLRQLGFQVESLGFGGCYRVTARPHLI